MKRYTIAGLLILGLTGSTYAQNPPASGQCAEENSRLQAAVTEAQNSMIQKILLQSRVTLLEQQVKALQDGKAKADTNPKAESAAEPAPVPPPAQEPPQ